MDLMDYSEEVYKQIQEDYLKFAEQLDIPDIQFVPISALEGDNVVGKSEKTLGLTARHLWKCWKTLKLVKTTT